MLSSKRWLFVRIAKGFGYGLMDGRAWEIEMGATLVLPPAQEATLRASQLSDVTVQRFDYDPRRTQGVLTLPDWSQIWLMESGELRADPQFSASHPVSHTFQTAVDEIAQNEGHLGSGALLGVAMAALRSLQNGGKMHGRARGGAPHRRFDHVIGTLQDKDFLGLSVEEMAGLCGCTKRHFHRMFRAKMGASIRDIANRLSHISSERARLTPTPHSVLEKSSEPLKSLLSAE